MSIIMPINTVKVYYNLALVLYVKGSVLKAVIVISVISTTINKWLKALLTSFIFNKVTFISINLANKAFSHLLTAVDITEIAITALSTDSFIYSINAEL